MLHILCNKANREFILIKNMCYKKLIYFKDHDIFSLFSIFCVVFFKKNPEIYTQVL